MSDSIVPAIPMATVEALVSKLPETPLSVIATTLDGTVVLWNHYAEVLYGWTAEEALGKQVVDLTVGPVRTEDAEAIMAALARGEAWAGNFECRRKDGSTISIAIIDMIAVDDDGEPQGIIGLSREHTGQLEVSLAELNEMRDLASRLDEVRRDESRRIAGQLHDEFSQRLHRLVERTTSIEARPDLSPETATDLAELLAMERDLISAMQSMWGSLRPPLLDDFGTVAAVEHLLADMALRLPGLEWVPVDPQLDEACLATGEAVVNVVQEALTNVAKHADASSCEVAISVEGDVAEVVVKDNGHGEIGPEGFGLRLLRERVRRQGGSFELEACPSSGTQLRVQLPLSSP